MNREKIFKVFLAVIFSLILFIVIIFKSFLNLVNQDLNLKQDIIFDINKGDSVSKVINNLYKSGSISSPKLTNIAIRIFEPKIIFKQGEYLLKTKISLRNYIKDFAAGKVIQRSVVILEGITVKLAKDILEKEKNLSGKITEDVLEGFLYPDTYYFESLYDRNKLIKKMKEKMEKFLEKIFIANEIIKTKKDLIILASIIEKETSINEERPMIAGVFLNRLRRNMPLQADPTIIYGLSEGRGYINRNLNYADLHKDSEFNSYTRRGLPPTPISIPSINSIRSVIYPAITDNLYFVANNKGGHCFANNLLKHNINVIKYRRNNIYDCE